MTPKILLINVHSSYNAGDAALTQAAIDQLYDRFPECQVSLVINDPDSYIGKEATLLSFLRWVSQAGEHQTARFFWLVTTCLISIVSHRLFRFPLVFLSPVELRATIKAYLESDLIVSTPGGYLFSYDKGRALIVLFFSIIYPILAGKPVYLFPQSFGPLKRSSEFWIAGWMLSRIRLIMVREPISLQHLKACHAPEERSYLLPDIAFAFEGESQSQALLWLEERNLTPSEERPLLGITVIDWATQYPGFQYQEEYEQAIKALIQHFIKEYSGKVIFYPQCWGPSSIEDDRIPAKRIAAQAVDLKDSILVVEKPIRPRLLKSIYAQMDIFLGTRMHSNIFALSSGVPVIAIGYLHKTQGIAAQVGIEDWVIDIEDVDEARLISTFDRLWDARAQVRAHLKKRMPELSREAQKAGEILLADYSILNEG